MDHVKTLPALSRKMVAAHLAAHNRLGRATHRVWGVPGVAVTFVAVYYALMVGSGVGVALVVAVWLVLVHQKRAAVAATNHEMKQHLRASESWESLGLSAGRLSCFEPSDNPRMRKLQEHAWENLRLREVTARALATPSAEDW